MHWRDCSRAGRRKIAGLRIFECTLYTVLQRQIDGRFVLTARTLGDEERTQRMFLGVVLERLGKTRRRNRSAR